MVQSKGFTHPAEGWRERSKQHARPQPSWPAAWAAASSKEDEVESHAMGDLSDPRHGPSRFIAYVARMKMLLAAKTAAATNAGLVTVTAAAGSGAARYLAFTSDVGEAMRPVVSPRIVNASYAIAGGYMIGDVIYQGYM
eukprot:scaffold185170_cov44-Prasinocladus_malaysianus.AAC.2